MFNKIADKAKALKDKANISQAISTTKQLASDSLNAGKLRANDYFEQNWPRIESVIVSGFLTVTEDKLKDDKIMEALLDKTYEVLPIAIRLVLPRAKFVEFSMKNRDSLLLKLQEQKIKKSYLVKPIEHVEHSILEDMQSPATTDLILI